MKKANLFKKLPTLKVIIFFTILTLAFLIKQTPALAIADDITCPTSGTTPTEILVYYHGLYWSCNGVSSSYCYSSQTTSQTVFRTELNKIRSSRPGIVGVHVNSTKSCDKGTNCDYPNSITAIQGETNSTCGINNASSLPITVAGHSNGGYMAAAGVGTAKKVILLDAIYFNPATYSLSNYCSKLRIIAGGETKTKSSGLATQCAGNTGFKYVDNGEAVTTNGDKNKHYNTIAYLSTFYLDTAPVAVGGTCSWKEETTVSHYTGEDTITGGCLPTETKDEAKCDQKSKPNGTAGGGAIVKYYCCCPPNGAAETPKEPFKLLDPLKDLKITIPGLDKIASQYTATCTDNGATTECTLPWIAIYIKGIFNYSMGILGILAAIALMIGGVVWIVAGGNASRITTSKAWISASITGLIIGLTSYMLLNEVNPSLTSLKSIEIKAVKEEFIETSELLANSSDFSSKDCSGVTVGWPSISRVITSHFMRADQKTFHGAYDIAAKVGDPVYSATDGTVITAISGSTSHSGCNEIVIKSGDLYFGYLHQSEVLVKAGDQVTRGQVIGKAGGDPSGAGTCHGQTTGAHIHFQIRDIASPWAITPTTAEDQKHFIDPANCLP